MPPPNDKCDLTAGLDAVKRSGENGAEKTTAVTFMAKYEKFPGIKYTHVAKILNTEFLVM